MADSSSWISRPLWHGWDMEVLELSCHFAVSVSAAQRQPKMHAASTRRWKERAITMSMMATCCFSLARRHDASRGFHMIARLSLERAEAAHASPQQRPGSLGPAAVARDSRSAASGGRPWGTCFCSLGFFHPRKVHRSPFEKAAGEGSR